MICPKCRTVNDDTYEFCQECGLRFSQDFGKTLVAPPPNNQFVTNSSVPNTEPPKTLALPHSAINLESAPPTNKDISATQYVGQQTPITPTVAVGNNPSNEFPTIVRQPEVYNPNFEIPHQLQPRKSSKIPLVLLGLLTLVLLGVVGFLVIPPLLKKPAILPDHFGLFTKKDDQFTELRSREFTNLLKGRDELKDDNSLPMTESNPNLIVYSDGQTIPVGDLKLVKLDGIKENGSIENWEYQVAPVDENSQMKQIKVPNGLPKGKYALALLKGNLDEGTHKLWTFRVDNGADSATGGKTLTLSLKPTPVPTPTPLVIKKTVTPTPEDTSAKDDYDGEDTATCIENNVVVRSSPTISESNKIGRLDRGQKVTIIKYSANEETWGGVTAYWLYVKTPKGKNGWVFGAFIQ